MLPARGMRDKSRGKIGRRLADQTLVSGIPQPSADISEDSSLTGHVPDQWHTMTGPSNWFQLRYPPGWNSQRDDNVLHFNSSDDCVTVTLHCLWLDEPGQPLDQDSLHLEMVFPVRRNVRPIAPLPIEQPSFGMEGDAILGPETPWWKRVLTRAGWRRWRIWVTESGPLRVIVVYLQDEEFDPEANTIVNMMLGSLDFSECLAEPVSKFADRVLAVARARFPGYECRLNDQQQLQLGDSTINLFNLYRTYANAPERFEEIVTQALGTLVDVQNWGTDRLNPDFDSVRDRIMPMLYPEEVWKQQFKDFVAQPWVAGLVILYVVDEAEAYWYVRDDLLETWTLTPDELHAVALRNLDQYFEDHAMEFMLTGEGAGPRLLLPQRPDAYNTARLLSVAFHASVQNILGREFAVGVPNRDFFVAVSLDSEDTLRQIQHKVREDFGRMDHPLSDRLLLVSTDGVSEYRLER